MQLVEPSYLGRHHIALSSPESTVHARLQQLGGFFLRFRPRLSTRGITGREGAGVNLVLPDCFLLNTTTLHFFQVSSVEMVYFKAFNTTRGAKSASAH
jgi:hypothetical protein